MADSRDYLTHYVKYFNMNAPAVTTQVVILLVLGAVAGGFSSAIINSTQLSGGLYRIILSGISAGMLVVSLPALLTVAVIKSIKRKMLLKHAMLTTLLISGAYAVLFFVTSAIFVLTRNAIIAYLFLVLVNAGIYGYWLIMGKFLIGRLRKDAIIAVVQPLLNVLFYIPLGSYILSFGVPLITTLVKLFGGMLVFLVIGYAFVYLLDRPSKKILEASGMNVIVAMVGEWLFDLTNDVSVIGQGVATVRYLDVEILAFKGADNHRAIFVNPDIHFGPFKGVGGSVAPLSLGKHIAERHKTTPFILHAPLDIQDNPVRTSQVYALTGHIDHALKRMGPFQNAYGNYAVAESGSCKVINVTVGDASLLFLTRTPYVTEDISRDVGLGFKRVAEEASRKSAILVDAHNCRYESAGEKELGGIQAGNPYIQNYENAIRKSAAMGKGQRLYFGAAHRKLAHRLGNPRDVGEGYTSVCVFGFGRRKLCIVYFDANNILPAFREKLVKHLERRFEMRVELCTTDTHSINTISSSARTCLGRYTNVNEVMRILDSMVKEALLGMEPVSYAYKSVKVENFPVWGEKADLLIERTSREVRRMLKYGTPFFVALAFVLAAWVIYVI